MPGSCAPWPGNTHATAPSGIDPPGGDEAGACGEIGQDYASVLALGTATAPARR
jgi:hypothetical protein